MMTFESRDIKDLHKILSTLHSRLVYLRWQRAIFGFFTPAYIAMEIEDTEEEIERTKAKLHRLGVVIDVLDDDRSKLLQNVRSNWESKTAALLNLPLIELMFEEKTELVDWIFEDNYSEFHRSIPSKLTEQAIIELFDKGSDSLLILGHPGSGKSTFLIKLIVHLISQAENDVRKPIPLILNLSSWSEKRLLLEKWILNELQKKYGVRSLNLAQALVKQKMIIPLLDGLDEVPEQHRSTCIEAINKRVKFDRVIVCSRLDDYKNSGVKLNLNKAVIMRDLTDEQVDGYLKQGDEKLNKIIDLRRKDEVWKEITLNPLMLNVVGAAFREYHGEILFENKGTKEELQAYIWDVFIKQMLIRHGKTTAYSNEQIIRWLNWLSRQLLSPSGSHFYLEQLQPDLLHTHKAVLHYVLIDRFISSLIACFVLSFGFICLVGAYGLYTYGLYTNAYFDYFTYLATDALVFGSIGAVAGGLFGGHSDDEVEEVKDRHKLWQMIINHVTGTLVGGILLGSIGWLLKSSIVVATIFGICGSFVGILTYWPFLGPRRIVTLGSSDWSWRRIRQILLASVPMGITVGLLYGQVVRSTSGIGDLIGNHQISAIIIGLCIGILISLIFGRVPRKIEKTVRPNQGIRQLVWDAASAAAIGGVIGLFFGIFATDFVVVPWLLFAMLSAVISGLSRGGQSVLSHIALRITFWINNILPLRMIRFLDYCVNRNLLKRYGGGYVFYHRLLAEYIAQKDGIANSVVRNIEIRRRPWEALLLLLVSCLIIFIGVSNRYQTPIAPVSPENDFVVQASGGLDNDEIRNSNVRVKPNDLVVVTASGQITLGTFSGVIDANGIDRGIIGLPIGNERKRVDHFPSGALLCRVSGESQWRKCGTSSTFCIRSEGSLEFLINDKHRRKGMFNIHVAVNSTGPSATKCLQDP